MHTYIHTSNTVFQLCTHIFIISLQIANKFPWNFLLIIEIMQLHVCVSVCVKWKKRASRIHWIFYTTLSSSCHTISQYLCKAFFEHQKGKIKEESANYELWKEIPNNTVKSSFSCSLNNIWIKQLCICCCCSNFKIQFCCLQYIFLICELAYRIWYLFLFWFTQQIYTNVS